MVKLSEPVLKDLIMIAGERAARDLARTNQLIDDPEQRAIVALMATFGLFSICLRLHEAVLEGSATDRQMARAIADKLVEMIMDTPPPKLAVAGRFS